ncbi:MAG: ABC transporter permease [Bacteroidetes bacterium]|nr:ABC transporter permease [Bacteroidota bacterium]
MVKWFLKRLLLLFFVLWGITTLTFIINAVVPRNPAIAMAGSQASSEQIEKLNARWGLDRPLYERYFKFYKYLFKGDLGTSIRTERPVALEMRNFFPATFELATFSVFLSFIIGVPLGIIAALKRNKWPDQVTRFISLIGVSLPNFWFGLIILLVFYFLLGGVGPGRVTSASFEPAKITGLYLLDSLLTGNWRSFADSFKHLIMPAFAMGFFGIGIVTRMMRSSMIDTLGKDYIKAARARGLSQYKVIVHHGIRNSLIPVLTVMGVLYGAYLGGVIVIEVVFSWPGLGNFAYTSILKSDHPAIMGVVLVISLLYSLVNLLVDILYRYLDPRIKF